jgi:hypothetical protein
MALKQGRMRETRKKKSGSAMNHWIATAPGRSARRSTHGRAAPKPLPRRIAM